MLLPIIDIFAVNLDVGFWFLEEQRLSCKSTCGWYFPVFPDRYKIVLFWPHRWICHHPFWWMDLFISLQCWEVQNVAVHIPVSLSDMKLTASNLPFHTTPNPAQDLYFQSIWSPQLSIPIHPCTSEWSLWADLSLWLPGICLYHGWIISVQGKAFWGAGLIIWDERPWELMIMVNPICCSMYEIQFFDLLFPIETETRSHKLVSSWREMGREKKAFCDRCLPPHLMFY